MPDLSTDKLIGDVKPVQMFKFPDHFLVFEVGCSLLLQFSQSWSDLLLKDLLKKINTNYSVIAIRKLVSFNKIKDTIKTNKGSLMAVRW